jgi:transcriptional regulator with XRE-family HTH domain
MAKPVTVRLRTTAIEGAQRRRAVNDPTLARRAGLSERTIWRVKRRAARVRVGTARAIARALGIRLAALIVDDDTAAERGAGRTVAELLGRRGHA